ncbi:copper resistance CopC/CopD family protein [Amycolatopsis nigrescens]|uniref:copper resistance CopC/CopD family protein n=1 Tax=Amycolatopsis nigrescens TaxID=381445 RepID=UPI00036715AC|nr:copper resistance protein CopC [Amycolatopsis nigrescens]
MAVCSRRLVVALGVFVIAMISSQGTASAHAVLVGSTPGSFEVLGTSPSEVTLRFNESVSIGVAEIRLIGPGGADVAGVSKPAHPPDSPEVVAATLPAGLAKGTYTVSYRVVSADSHPVQGAFAFSVGEVTGGVAAGTDAGTASGAVSLLYGITRWLAYAGLALLIGSAFFVAVCWPGGEAMAGARRLLWTGWGTLTGATVGTLLIYGPYAAGGSMGDLTDPALLGSTLADRMGVTLAVRLVLLGLIAVGLRYLRRSTPFGQYQVRNHRRRAVVVLATGAALAVTWSLANHSATGAQVGLAIPADAIHLLAMAVWLGGLPVLLGVLLRSGDVGGMRTAIPRFSATAPICVGVLMVTGTYQAWREVGTPAALFGTAYGLVLAAKVGVVVVLVGLGGLARNWVRRHYAFEVVTVSDKRRARRGPAEREVGRFRRMISVEVTVASVLLGLTASLVSAEPAAAELTRIRALESIPERTGPVNVVLPFDAGGGEQGAGKLAALVMPGAVGRNEVHLAVLDVHGKPKQVPELRAELRLPARSIGPLPVEMRLISGDHAIAQNAPITMPGQWELAVTVRTSEVDQAVVRIPVGVR